MADLAVLGNLMWEVLRDGQPRTLEGEAIESFHAAFHEDISERIDIIRNEQRKAYEEERNMLLS